MIKTKELAKLKVIKKRKNHPNTNTNKKQPSLSRLSSNVDSAEEEPRPIYQPVITFEEYKRNRNLEY